MKFSFLKLPILTVTIFLSTGCAVLSDLSTRQQRNNQSIERQELEKFIGSFSNRSSDERAIICGSMFEIEKGQRTLLDRLELAYAVAVTPGCGSSGEAIELLESAKKEVKEPRLKGIVDYQLLLLKRLQGVSNYALQLKSKESRSREEAKVLKQKLDAIKSIEKALIRIE